MTRIGILGASSQVGASVALFLRKFPNVQVSCFIRSSYSKVYFESLGIEYQYINIDDAAAAKEKLENLDVVLDFGYPAGQLHEILGRSKNSIGKTLQAMKKDGIYIYMSSIMAYGMPDNTKWIGHYSIPRTSYAYIKRSIEKFTAASAGKLGIKAYNFRLGQVHGFLQSVNGSYRKKLSDANIVLIDGKPEDPVNIIFIHPLCEAIMQCINGVHAPGLYTLVSTPQWTLKDLYDYYIRYYGLPANIRYKPKEEKKKRRSLFQRSIDIARPYRSILETYILMRFPKLAISLKGQFRQSELSNQSASYVKKLEYLDYNLLGTPPFKMIEGLTTDPAKTLQIEKEEEKYYNSIITAAQR